MRHSFFSISILGVVAVMMLNWLGCSFIGLGLGAKADAKKPYKTAFQNSYLEQIGVGTETNLLLRQGEEVSGKYVGLYTTADAQDLLILLVGTDTTRVPLNEISHISVRRGARMRGFMIGAFLDLVAVGALRQVWKKGQAYN